MSLKASIAIIVLVLAALGGGALLLVRMAGSLKAPGTPCSEQEECAGMCIEGTCRATCIDGISCAKGERCIEVYVRRKSGAGREHVCVPD